MGLARDLVELEKDLRNRPGLALFAPLAQSGLNSNANVSALLARVSSEDNQGLLATIQLCLQALRIQHDSLRPKMIDAELVATLPTGAPGLAFSTEIVVRRMIENAQDEIILLGYEFTDDTLLQLIASAAQRQIRTVIICDRGRGSAKRIGNGWPKGFPRARIYYDKERRGAARYASMHAKCLLVDASDLLVTSANFTFHGMRGNIEIGVRLKGAPAGEARKIFSYLVENGLVTEI